MIGKNHINLIKLALKMLIIQIKIMNKLKKNILAGKINFLLILFLFFLINVSFLPVQKSSNAQN